MKRLCVCKILRVLKNALSKQATELLPSKTSQLSQLATVIPLKNHLFEDRNLELIKFWKILDKFLKEIYLLVTSDRLL